MKNDLELVQDLWHDVFGGNIIPSNEGACMLLDEAIDLLMVMDAIYICSEKNNITSFDARFAYIKGIIRNKRSSKLSKKWGE